MSQTQIIITTTGRKTLDLTLTEEATKALLEGKTVSLTFNLLENRDFVAGCFIEGATSEKEAA